MFRFNPSKAAASGKKSAAPAQPQPPTTAASQTAHSTDTNPSATTMIPSAAVDVLFLTFNCAKNFIDVPIFATHLRSALKQRVTASDLPELVVFSLQEIAPIAYSFIGGYFLSPYLTRYEEALNLAADAATDPDAETDDDTPALLAARPRPVAPVYTLVRTKNVGMTALLLFAREPSRITDVQEAEVGFGAAEMGNKGAAGLRVSYQAADTDTSTEMTFVGTHLAAMEWNLAKRNANWAAIMRGLSFENPETILKPKRVASSTSPSPGEQENGGGEGRLSFEEAVRLLHDQHTEESRQMQDKLHDISVFKPGSHLFVGGDLNYRISAASPAPDSNFPSLDPLSEHYHPRFFPLDQLTRERRAGRTLHGLTEAPVDFPPTYKYDILPANPARRVENPLEVQWKFAPHRFPSWTDRILYLDIPPWTKASSSDTPEMKVQAYDALPVVASSDHRAVFLRVDVPVIEKEALLPPSRRDESGGTVSAEWDSDPRVRLPVAIDPEAWERRAVARRREVMAGWSMFLWSTQEGAIILGTLMVAAVGSWWLYKSW